MKKFQITLSISIALIVTNRSFAQTVSSSVINKYPSAIIVKVYNTLVKTPLSEQKQVALAELFSAEDEEIATTIRKGGVKDVQNIKSKYESMLEKTLSPQELTAVKSTVVALSENDRFLNSNSKFLAAIQNEMELGLTPVQIDSLKANGLLLEKLKASFTSLDPKKKYDAQNFENVVLPRLLNDSQINLLFSFRYKDQAAGWAVGDWKELKSRNLSSGLDSLTVVSSIIKYDIARSVVNERYKSDPAKKTLALRKVDETIPESLTLLKAARRYNNPIDSAKNGKSSKSAFTY